MRLPSAQRVAATGLAIAAITIFALSALALGELDREAEMHREVIAGVQLKDSLEALRVQLTDLEHAARIGVLTGLPDARQAVERRAVEIDAELDYLAQHPLREDRGAIFEELAHAARALVVNARSVALARRAPGMPQPSTAEMDRATAEVTRTLERTLAAQSARINERTLAQLRAGETLRAYVSWLLVGSIVVLVGLFGFYRWAKAREDAAARRIEHLAHYDTVTGLPNRALLADRLEQEVARARRGEQGFALLMFDLDGFKDVNDTWGHAAGDRLLAAVGARARQSVRASDTVGRQGGDEFLAILPEATLGGALLVAEKLRESLAQPYPVGAAQAHLSASIGVSIFPAHGHDADTLQRAADAALYEAKRTGRNKVTVAGGAAPASA